MLTEIENIFELKKNKILAKENVESSNQSHIFWTFLESEDFKENFNDKLLLNLMFHEGDLAFEQYRSSDLPYGDYFLEKMNAVKSKLSKEYENFSCFEAPLLAYKEYKKNNFSESATLLEKSIISLENLFDKSYTDALYGKIEQITNIIKVNIKSENWQSLNKYIENFASDLSLQDTDNPYFFRKNEMEFFKSQISLLIESTVNHFFETLFFALINYHKKNDFLLNFMFKHYNLDINKLQYDSVHKKYYIDDLEFFNAQFPLNIEKYFLKNYLFYTNNEQYKKVIDNYISFID
ncbi:hypothetical protein ODZ84_10580 [Chryseobacterium fluminis]|uniref:hypothetical protein n=1 Tax=Chryseobacterium fluminis TaxID=2983606 RepID=UPI00224F8EFD|nr:hypothetical protein [Chryseobacterium sp. MMS21-Ot14]UZT99973.1 hypothetical protein ODZ84_10580 [Chryseobacterium sp. MMS21-Ot14]